MRITTRFCLFLFMLQPVASQASSSQGDWFVHVSGLSSFYQYEEDDARKEFPSTVQSFLDDNDFTGDDSDYLNTSLGFGYYLSDDLDISLTYTSGIELNFLNDLFTPLLSSTQQTRYDSDADLQMLELDLRYKAYQILPSLALMVKGGVVINQLDVDISAFQDEGFVKVADGSETEFGAKLGLGLQWDFADNWALKGGYSHLTFLSMDKTYLQLEYRF